MRILVDENIPLGRETLGSYGEVVSFAGRGLARKDLDGCDALMVRSVTRVDENLLKGTPVKFVGTATIGTDHVDLPWLERAGIGFASAPGSNANSVAEYVVAALLHLRKRKGFTTEGKTLGIIGWGNVGKQVEKKAPALGLRVLRCDPPLEALAQASAEAARRDSTAAAADFTELSGVLAESDILTLHVPLVKSGPHATLGLAGEKFFAALQRPVALFNTCRGGVIDEGALKAALAHRSGAGRVEHLVLDVFAGEPRIDAETVAAADLVSPHIAGYSLQGKLNGTAQIAEAFHRHFGLPAAPSPAWPKPSAPEIPYRGGEDWEFIAACVSHAYDIAGDDRRLRASLSDADPGKSFDLLRKQYPIRHEFSAFQVMDVTAQKRDLASRLRGLGFLVANTRGA